MKETYSNNRVGLLVAFGGDVATDSYTPTNRVEEALEYFNLYVDNGVIYAHTEADAVYDELGVDNQTEVEELRTSLNAITATLSDEAAAEHPILFKEWKANTAYAVGDRIRYRAGLYKVLTAHTSQATWTPDAAPSLFAILLNPDPTIIYEWVQPDSTNGYATGAQVYHNGILWTSTADNNVWEPGALNAPWSNGSEPEITPEPEPEPTPGPEPEPEIAEWEQRDANNPYMASDQVLFNGSIYESLIDNNVWSPADYPAGWQQIIE